MAKILGIGSRVKHADYGVGVVTNVTSELYWITFIDNGLETVTIDTEMEIIEAVDDEVDTVSFYEVEKTLRNLLKQYSDISEIVPIADKYKGGTLTLSPADAGLASKDIPIEMRGADEVRGVNGAFGQVSWAPECSNAFNPAFDVTPAELVTGWVLDTGVYNQKDLVKPLWWLG